MVFTKRERQYGIVVLLGLGVLLIDQLIINPILDYRTNLKNELAAVDDQITSSQSLIKNQALIERNWKQIQSAGLKNNPSDTETVLARELAMWGNEAGLTLTSSRQDHSQPDKSKDFHEISIRATGNGSMSAIAQMVKQVETAYLPVRISALSITPRNKEGTDDLTVQFAISALWQEGNKALTTQGGTKR